MKNKDDDLNDHWVGALLFMRIFTLTYHSSLELFHDALVTLDVLVVFM